MSSNSFVTVFEKYLFFICIFFNFYDESVSLQLKLARSKSLFEIDDQMNKQLSELHTLHNQYRYYNFSTLTLASYFDDTFYTIMDVGTPLHYHKFLIDTGRSESWIASSLCTDLDNECFCGTRNYYNHSASSSYRRVPILFNVEYGNRQTLNYWKASGTLASDIFKVTMGGPNVHNFEFGEVYHFVGSNFKYSQWDGALGLAKESSDRYRLPLFLKALLNQTKTLDPATDTFTLFFYTQNDFSYPHTAILDYGPVDHNKWQSPQSGVADCLPRTPKWKIIIDLIAGGGINICFECRAIIDSAFMYMAGPKDIVDTISTYIGTKSFGDLNTVDCDKLFDLRVINMTIGGTVFQFVGGDYIIKLYKNKVNICVSAFIAENLHPNGLHMDTFTMGITFIKRFYIAFKMSNTTPTVQFFNPNYSYYGEAK